MRKTAALLVLACAAGIGAIASAQAPQAHPTALRIPFESYALPNGLRVVLAPSNVSPTVAVTAWYHVGSKNETVGKTGFAHLFEHVMFTGSGHVPYGVHDRLTEGVGGSNNGTTSRDRTTYYETVPSNYLETALWLESDRMGFLLDTLDVQKLDAQRDIVKNERRQRMDNQPYGLVEEIVSSTLYPPAHPYSWSVIGSMTDLTAASEADVKDFFRLYYAPGNAILSIAGDFQPAQAKALVRKYFGAFPRGAAIVRPAAAPVTHNGETRLVYEDRVQVPRLVIVWPTVGSQNDDRFALAVLDAISAGPRTTRLTKALVYDRQLATSITATQDSDESAGEWRLTITPRPGVSLTDLETAADAILDTLKAQGPTAEEIQRATAGLELEFIDDLESNLGKSMRLADGLGYQNDAGYFQTEYQKMIAVSPADVKRVANKYLTKGRLVLSVVPIGKTEMAARPSESTPYRRTDR
ncbi:MAG TPA: pitrilysin family protein [Vicinamibacterales bacterium]|nr:pitrilysin family protein [Vicinamibacterales bacterium]